MKFSFPMPGGGSGVALFSKLVRTKDLRTLQGENTRSTKPKLTVSIFKIFMHSIYYICIQYTTSPTTLPHHLLSNENFYCHVLRETFVSQISYEIVLVNQECQYPAGIVDTSIVIVCITRDNNPLPLQKCLTTIDLTSLGIGSCCGTGMYLVAGMVAKNIAGPGVILSFCIAAIASIFSGKFLLVAY